MRGVDVEEDSRDHDRSLFQELFEEGLEGQRGREIRVGQFRVKGEPWVGLTRPLFNGGGRLSKFNQI